MDGKMESVESGELFSDSKFLESSGREANEYRKVGKFCDFTLKLKSTGASIKVHKVVLASSCPYFSAMFDSKMIECEKGSLEFEDFITETELENVLEYLYTGCISIPFSSAKVYYEHAVYFRLESLANLCTGLMIKNINLETCLDLWRFGMKFSNEKLKINSLEYILRNASNLFENDSFLNLTVEEIKILISDDKMVCTEEKIFTFLMKWLNHDLENRNMNFNQLIEEIRFPLMTNKFLKSIVVTNDFLLEKNDMQKIEAKIVKFKLDSDEISCLKFDKINSPRVGFRQKNLVAVLDKTIYHFGSAEDDVLPIASLTGSMCIGARITTFAKNYLLLAGGEDSKNCEHYCPVTHMVKPFPSMNKSRFRHGITTLHDKIYCCGGVNNAGSVEVFDLGAGVWTEGSRLNGERYDFGITTWDNAIYVIGGSNNNLERYDPREDRWCLLPVMPEFNPFDPTVAGEQLGLFNGQWKKVVVERVNGTLTRSFAFNNAVYNFKSVYGDLDGFIFDIRANKWMEENVSKPPHNWFHFDLTLIDDKVYIMGMCSRDQLKGNYCCTYDITTNKWLDTAQKLPSHQSVSVTTMLT